mgnify:CR=1 FL=1|jgi:hypothetical protein
MYTIDDCAVSAIGLFVDLVQTHEDLSTWPNDPLEVNGRWLRIALDAGRLSGEMEDYRWVLPGNVTENEQSGSFSAVIALNVEFRVRYRLKRHMLGTDLVLMKVLNV